jgi:polar amino acid transport system permease protein
VSGFAFDWTFARSILPELLTGFRLTIIATLFGSLIAVTLGLALCYLRMARIPVVSRVCAAWIQFIRGTPFLVQLYFVFYVAPNWGLAFSAFATGVVALGVYYSAYAAEIYRAGIEDVPVGQWEASLTLGLPLKRVWFGVVLPQAVRAVLPVLANLVIAMFKESALLSSITVMELLATGKAIGSINFRYIEPLTLVGVLYFVVSYGAARAVRSLELRHAVAR